MDFYGDNNNVDRQAGRADTIEHEMSAYGKLRRL